MKPYFGDDFKYQTDNLFFISTGFSEYIEFSPVVCSYSYFLAVNTFGRRYLWSITVQESDPLFSFFLWLLSLLPNAVSFSIKIVGLQLLKKTIPLLWTRFRINQQVCGVYISPVDGEL
ncbi:MAG: hypothetical protein CMD78_02780 [Gammaproteobacteria bacterium]|nr:hypothetical protein [Gammaproteobacteria bacterium]|tara:strand:+ start:19951 stop:20304 length:354 start_codon:yes stop_codon:yes gene_type:complete